MKILCILLTVASLQISAKGFTQTITVSLKNAPLENLFKIIEQQSGYSFVYTNEAIERSKPVSINVRNESIENVLKLSLQNQLLTYSIVDKFIIIKPTDTKKDKSSSLNEVRGKVLNEKGEPLAGVTIMAKNSKKATSTNESGEFTLDEVDEHDHLLITSIGYNKEEILIGKEVYFVIHLTIAISTLDETIIKGYYTTSRRLNTGTVSKVSSAEIANQPVSNPLAALQGRVPGLFITQANGLPGSAFDVLIRGKNSIQQGTSPLYIIDGVPFSSEAMTQSSLTNASSPFNIINPLDIESIEVLRDADATAIYGSRGANGVILITTKSGKSSKKEVSVSFYTGWGKVTRTINLMNTQQYITMRKEAYANDGVPPTVSNAPDLLVWDTTRYTNWTDEMIGNTASNYNLEARYSDGNDNTRFSIGLNYNKQTTVFPGDFSDQRVSTHLNLNHQSRDKKFRLNITSDLGFEENALLTQDLTSFTIIAPNAPHPYDAAGNLVWSENGVSYSNPFARLLQTHTVNTDRLGNSITLSYSPIKVLQFSINGGHNYVHLEETIGIPIVSQNPANNPKGSATFAYNQRKDWIIEPQAKFTMTIKQDLKIETIAGMSFQESLSDRQLINATGYTNDELINSFAGAASISGTDESSQYRYHGIYGRINFNYNNKYLVNLTGRRDGSSRFGPGNQFANFGAIGVAWIITGEKFMDPLKTWFTYAKIRSSFGITGNDQISNYQYLESWTGTTYPYGSTPGIRPTKLFNPDYRWEQNKKLEAGLDLGLFRERLTITMNLFYNESGNQIISYQLPSQTGFSSVLRNFPGLVMNKGLEIEINSKNIQSKDLSWITYFNFTRNVNKLKEFPGLETSSYANRYRIDEPLNLFIGYDFLGVNQQTGIYEFADLNGDNVINTKDIMVVGTRDPVFYGGIGNKIDYKGFTLDFLFQFVNQKGNHAYYSSLIVPGRSANQSNTLTNRWQKPGDLVPYQKYSATTGTPASVAGGLVPSSDAALTDASYIRLKNVSLYYNLPFKLKKQSSTVARLFVQAQNLFVFTNYAGADPEVQSIQMLPPTRVVTTGFQINL